MLMQEIWSEDATTMKSQYDGLKGGSNGVERQRIAFIQQWSYSRVSGHPHKMELSHPYRDLCIILSYVKFYN